jgi:hypothetical protein
MARHNAIAAIVGRYDTLWKHGSAVWRHDSTLKSICSDLDREEIDIPGSWKAGKTLSLKNIKLKGWHDALELGFKKLVMDQLKYSLQIVIEKTAEPMQAENSR